MGVKWARALLQRTPPEYGDTARSYALRLKDRIAERAPASARRRSAEEP